MKYTFGSGSEFLLLGQLLGSSFLCSFLGFFRFSSLFLFPGSIFARLTFAFFTSCVLPKYKPLVIVSI